MLFEPLGSVHCARWCGLRGGYAIPTLEKLTSSGRSRLGTQQNTSLLRLKCIISYLALEGHLRRHEESRGTTVGSRPRKATTRAVKFHKTKEKPISPSGEEADWAPAPVPDTPRPHPPELQSPLRQAHSAWASPDPPGVDRRSLGGLRPLP
ncbi:unnamed protein product [Gulo gulo]|uniref:Uncharacterized protein n=1 Tax=Gulo gulo TaxID=48420 RepID=A0A9X9PZU6_GULGU|nr:unnamed protein product [Gulo gulo]